MNKKPTYWQWLVGLSLMLFIWGNSDSLYAQSMADRAEQAMIEAMHGPTTEVPYSEGNRAVGDNCTTPIVVNIPSNLPYADANTTCGRGNSCINNNMDWFFMGEDIVYQLNVMEQTEVIITMDPKGNLRSGLGLFFSTCPNNNVFPAGSYWVATGFDATLRTIKAILNPGTYYLVADSYPSGTNYTCIPEFDLAITQIMKVSDFPFIETFETTSTSFDNWTQVREYGTVDWTFGTGADLGNITAAFEGTLNARYGSGGYDRSPRAKLISPVLDLTNLSSPRLSFYLGQELTAANNTYDYNDTKVFYKTSAAAPWVLLKHYDYKINQWTLCDLELPDPSANYQIAFEGHSNNGPSSVIDLVTVYGGGLEIVNSFFYMNERPIGAWMEPAPLTFINIPGRGDVSITASSVDNNIGGFLEVANPTLPYTLASGATTKAFGIAHNTNFAAAPGPFNGVYSVTYGNNETASVLFSGTIYEPATGDVVENPFILNPTPSPAPVPLPSNNSRGAGAWFKNYNLPDDFPPSSFAYDNVYKLTPAVNMLLNVNVYQGQAIIALYEEGFAGEGGPMAHNSIVHALNTLVDIPLTANKIYYAVGSAVGLYYAHYIMTPAPIISPDMVTYNAPANGAFNINNGSLLNWTFGANTDEYQLMLGTTNPPTDVVVDFTSPLATSYILSGLLSNKLYYWQVNAKNASATTEGPVWSFITAPSPDAANYVAPQNGAINIFDGSLLNWTFGSFTDEYQLMLGTTNPPTNVVVDFTTPLETSYTLTGLLKNTTYYWQVNTKNAGFTTAGPVWSFITAPPVPGPAAYVAPTNAATDVENGDLLSWVFGDFTAEYQVMFGETNPPTEVAVDFTSTLATSFTTFDLLYSTTYYWQVNAKNVTGTTAGEVWSFTTVPPPPGLSILNPKLAMGYRPIGAWMEPARFNIINMPGKGDLTITATDIDNNYNGFIKVVSPALPYTLVEGTSTMAFGLGPNAEATAVAGPFNGQYALIYGSNRALATALYSGTTYVPVAGDVVENAIALPPAAAATAIPKPVAGYYKNYILPNDIAKTPSSVDAVNKITPALDMLLNTTATSGMPVNFAVYAADFAGEGGPMATNAMVQSLNSLVDVELHAGKTYYMVSSAAGAYAGTYTLAPMPVPDAVTYVAPLDGAVNIINGTSLSWTFGNNTSQYELVLGTTYPPTTVVVPYTSTLATSYILAGLQPNLQYFWRVNVKNTQGTTAGPVWGFTTTIDVPTAFTVTLADPAPTATTVTANLNWTGPSDRAFIGYNVYRGTTKLNTTPITVSQYIDLGLARNTSYTYKVTNVYDEGESAATAPKTVTTKGVGIFNGFVYDFLTNAPIAGARVDVTGPAGTYSMTTAANGAYNTQAYAGTYSIAVSATDYTSQTKTNQVLAHAATVSNNFNLMETPYAVTEVVAVQLNDNSVQISWTGPRGIISYDIWREKVYQPGTLEKIGTSLGQHEFVDFSWGTQNWGVYRWAVSVNYDAGQVSAKTFSNTLDKKMNTKVNVTVALNSGDSPAGTLVTFTNTSEPGLDLVYEETLGGSGLFTWNMFRKGVYNIEVFKAGYTAVSLAGVNIIDETSFEWLLDEILAPPTALYVNPTGYARWQGGSSTPFEPFMENFDGGVIPAGWVVETGTGANATGAKWAIAQPTTARPFTNSAYMKVDSDAAPSSGLTHSLLYTPIVDASNAGTLYLEFDQYYNYISGLEYADVQVFDGAAWITVLHQVADKGSWTVPNHQVIDVSAYANAAFQVRFDYNAPGWKYYWAIDNVAFNEVASRGGDRSFVNYKVFHDGVLVAQVEDREYQYGTNGEALVDGETYLAEVATVYSTGQSARASYTWTYKACTHYAAPGNFAAAQVQGALDVNLTWTKPTIPVAEDQIAVARIYRDGIAIAETNAAMYLDEDLDIGSYQYCITFVYESGAESCPGTICKTAVVTGGGFVSGNVKQAAYLGGANIQGAAVTLTSGTTTFTFTTNASGNYSGEVLGNKTYNYTVEAAGYVTQTLTGVEILMTETEVRNFLMMEFPAPVELVNAEEINDNQVKVSWRSPGTILFEPYMEDFSNGLADWTSSAANWGINASNTAGGTAPELRFNWSPSGTGDYSIISPVLPYASSNNALYLSFKHMVNDFSGGYTLKVITVADGVTHVVQSWTPTGSIPANTFNTVITAEHGLGAAEFQIGFVFSGETFDINYWYIDDVVVTNTRAHNNTRALPTSTLAGYNVYRTTCVDGGNMQFLGYTLDSIFNDNTWATAASGTYKWAVEAVYAENESEIRFSNCLDKNMTTAVSVKVTTNSGDLADGTAVVFTNTSEPELELVYSVTLDETGYYAWPEFRKGVYDIHVEKNGFAAIDISNETINGPKNYVWLLEELLLPISDLHVSPTGYATWSGGGVIPFEPFIEDFSAGIDNWTRIPAATNWQLSQTSLAGGAAPEVRFYWSPNSTNRFYFISPMMSTLTQTELEMSFTHYISDYSGTYDIQLVTIADGVEHLVMDFPAASIPATNVVTTLTAAHGVGAEEFQIAFVFDGVAFDINNWNIDNIMLNAPGTRELEYYKVWLDGIFISDTPDTFYQYDPAILTPGQEYFSEVAAIYSNGMSAKMNYTWTYYPCDSFPGPANLTYEVVNTNNVVLNWSGNTPPPPPPGGEGIDEDFEGGSMPQGWTVNTTNSGTNGPVPSSWTINNYVSADFSPFGTYHAGMWWDYGHQDEWLITPEFTCDAGAVMNFWTAVYEGSVNGDHYYVKVSTNGGSTWTSIWDASSLSGNAWNYYNSPYNIALTAYAGQEIKLAFQAVDGDGQGLWYVWFVDNVTVASPGRTIAFSPESLIRKSNSVGNNDQIARNGNIARIERASSPDYSMYAGEGEFVAEKATSATGIEIGFQDTQTREAVEIHYDNGYDNNAVGTGGAVTFMSAVRFTETELAQYYGNYELTDVKFIIHDPAFTNVTVKVWEGGSYGNPGTEVYSKDVTSQVTATTMTTATLTNAIALTAGKEYWIGYEVTVTTGYPAAVDAGPMVSGKGAWMYFGGAWDELTNISASLNYNWVIRGIINTTGGSNPGSSTFDPGEYLGANVYRDGELIAEMVQGETYSDLEVDPGYYDYCVTFVYEGNAMSCMTTCVTDVLVTEDCQVPQNLTATVGLANETTLEWNGQTQQEFRYDDGTSTGQLGFSGGTTDGILGAKHTASAEITEMSWYTTAEGGPHTSVKIYVLGLTAAGMPNANNVLYSATVTNTDDTWNTHTLPTPVTATGGFYIALGFNGFAGLGTDDGIGAPYVYQNNTHYYSSDYTGNAWTTFESSGFSVNAMIRAIGIVDAKASYAVAPETTPEMAAEFDKTLSTVVYNITAPVATGTPDWSVPVRSMNREFLGYNIYKDGSLFVALWPETTYVYEEGRAQICYTVTAEYEYCGETDPSNEACIIFPPISVKSTDLSLIRVYPNPSNSTVNIELTNNVSQVVIYNYLGQVVLENNITDQTTLQIDVRNYEAGAYLVKFVTSEGQSITKKVVVTK